MPSFSPSLSQKGHAKLDPPLSARFGGHGPHSSSHRRHNSPLLAEAVRQAFNPRDKREYAEMISNYG